MKDPANLSPRERQRDLGLFCRLVLLGPAELLERVAAPAQAAERFRTFDAQNARDFLLFRCLVEVQKAGFSMQRAIGFLQRFDALDESEKKNAFSTLDVEAVVAELSVWHRKLVEVLFRLVGFSQTNDVAYYYHYLSVVELEALLFEQMEQRDFFASSSEYRRHEVDKLASRLGELTATGAVDIAQCWYVAAASFENQLRKRKAPLSASVKALAQFALRNAKPAERQALGYCYRHAFSVPSATIHFSSLPAERKLDVQRLEVTGFQIAFLAFSVIARVEALWGMRVDGEACNAARRSAERGDIVGPFEQRAEVGDFVVVTVAADRAYIAEVLEVLRSDYGNESYRVKYFVDKPHSDVTEDTVMPDLVHEYVKGRDAVVALAQRLRELNTRPDGSVDEAVVSGLLATDLSDALRDGVGKTWTLGVSAYVHREMAKSRDA